MTPHFEPVDRLNSRVLWVTAMSTLAGIPASLVFLFLGAQRDQWDVYGLRAIFALIVAVAGLCSLWFLRRRRYTAGAWLLSVSLLLVGFLPPVALGLGVRGASLPILVVPVVVMGLLVRPRAALIVGGVVFVAFVSLGLAEWDGLLVGPLPNTTPPAFINLVVLCALIASVSLIIASYASAFRSALDELAQARVRADAASAAKSRFLATMSHEIRTPLNGVLGMAQLLQSGGLTDAQRQEAADVILGSGQVLLALLNDVLDLTRAESGRLPITPTPTQPQVVLAETCALFAPAARERTHPLHWEWSGPADAAYLLDGIRLRQMLSNLVNNAIKFSQGGEVQVRGRVDGETLRFEVSDEGPGVPVERLGQLFRPFSQLDAVQGGSGLGLSIVRTLAEEMGGSTGVRNNPTRGATFWFTLTAHPVEAPAATVKENAAPLEGHGKRVLVVEDNRVNQRLTELLLARAHFEVTCVENGQEAVDWLASHEVDLVLMDCQMPVMDGFEATRVLRARPAERRLPIVALTASAFPEDRAQCLAAGMDDLLLKPLDLKALRLVMSRWLR